MNLYQTTASIEEVLLLIDENEGVYSDDCLLDTWELLDMEFNDKIESWCKAIKNIETESSVLKEEAKRLSARASQNEKLVTRMKSVMAECMNKVGKPKIKTTLFSVNRLKINGKLDIDSSIKNVPDEYIKVVAKTEKQIDKEKIRAVLEQGKKLPFARFYNSITIS